MHFHCTQCRHQFCSGCYNAFYAKNVSSESGGGERGGQLWGWGAGTGGKAMVGRIESISLPSSPLCMLQTLNVTISSHSRAFPPCTGVLESPGPQQFPTSFSYLGFTRNVQTLIAG